MQFPLFSSWAKSLQSHHFEGRRPSCSAQCRQCMQRLLKTLHRDDPQTSRILARLGRVLPSGDEEDVDTGGSRAEGLLLHAADRGDAAVEIELARRGDLQAVADSMAELLVDIECERESG